MIVCDFFVVEKELIFNILVFSFLRSESIDETHYYQSVSVESSKSRKVASKFLNLELLMFVNGKITSD